MLRRGGWLVRVRSCFRPVHIIASGGRGACRLARMVVVDVNFSNSRVASGLGVNGRGGRSARVVVDGSSRVRRCSSIVPRHAWSSRRWVMHIRRRALGVRVRIRADHTVLRRGRHRSASRSYFVIGMPVRGCRACFGGGGEAWVVVMVMEFA